MNRVSGRWNNERKKARKWWTWAWNWSTSNLNGFRLTFIFYVAIQRGKTAMTAELLAKLDRHHLIGRWKKCENKNGEDARLSIIISMWPKMCNAHCACVLRPVVLPANKSSVNWKYWKRFSLKNETIFGWFTWTAVHRFFFFNIRIKKEQVETNLEAERSKWNDLCSKQTNFKWYMKCGRTDISFQSDSDEYGSVWIENSFLVTFG